MSRSRPAAVSCRTRASGVRKVFQPKRRRVEKTTAVMVSCGRSKVARKNRAMAKRVHQRGMGLPPAAESCRNSSAASIATTAVKSVTIQSLPRKMSRPTRTMRTMAVRMRFMRSDEDTGWGTPLPPCFAQNLQKRGVRSGPNVQNIDFRCFISKLSRINDLEIAMQPHFLKRAGGGFQLWFQLVSPAAPSEKAFNQKRAQTVPEKEPSMC